MLRELQGGGVVFFSCPPEHPNDIYFLLGKERYNPSWRGSSCKWGGFAGNVLSRWESLMQVASREACEELLAMNVFNMRDGWMKAETIHKRLKDKQFAFEIQIYRVPYGSAKAQREASRRPTIHGTYFVEIAWQPKLPKIFLALRTKLLSVLALFKKFRRAFRSCSSLEKSFFEFSYNHCLYVICLEHRCWTRFSRKNRLMSLLNVDEPERTKKTFIYWQNKPGEKRRRLLGNLRFGCLSLGNQTYHFSIQMATALELFKKLVKELTPVIEHPALKIQTAPSGGLLSLELCSSYIEKEEIGWWSGPLLHCVLANEGRYCGETFRTCSLPTLKIALDLTLKNLW